MKENINMDFTPTENSLNILNNVIKNMKGSSFHNHNHILYDICNSLDSDNVTYFEIGCYAGASASLMSINKKVKKCYSLDIGVPIDKQIPIENVKTFKHNLCQYEYIQGDSTDKKIINYVHNNVSEIDILYIDGNHDRDYVINDFNNYEKLVKKNGYIVFDDYLDFKYSPQVYDAVNFIVKNLNLEEYKLIGSIEYDFMNKTNVMLNSNNLFVIKKI